jgi:hypothetical protein
VRPPPLFVDADLPQAVRGHDLTALISIAARRVLGRCSAEWLLNSMSNCYCDSPLGGNT